MRVVVCTGLLLLLCCLLGLPAEGKRGGRKRRASDPLSDECQMWNRTLQALAAREGLNVTCNPNTPCTGFDCFGYYKVMSLGDQVSFGLEFRPCSVPLSLQLYLMNGGSAFIHQLNMSVADQYIIPVPGASHTSALGSTEGNITIYLAPPVPPSTNRATIELKFTLRLTPAPPFPPQEHILQLIPRTEVLIPSCVDTQTTPRPAPTSTQALVPLVTSRSGPGTDCKMNVMHACGDHQQCAGTPSVCSCMLGYTWTGVRCEPLLPPGGSPTAAPSGGSETLVIVLSCLGSALVLGLLVAVIRYKYVRYRARYSQHTLLVNSAEADEGLEEADPPMIEA